MRSPEPTFDAYLPEDNPAPRPAAEGSINVREILAKVYRRWKLIAAAMAVALLAAVVHYAITPEEYLASTNILIERRSLLPLANSQAPWLENWWNMEYYPTQYRLLESRGLAERVVKNLHLADDPQFNPGAQLLPAGSLEAGSTLDDDRAALGRLANRLLAGLSVEPDSGTQFVRISYRSSRPELAARVANGFAEAYIDWGIETRSTTAGKASDFVAQQIDELKAEIDERERERQALSRSQDVLDLAPESNVVYQRLDALNRDYVNAKRQRIEAQARYEELRATPRQAVADAQSSGLVGDLMKEQLRLEREYESKLETYKPDFPAMVELKGEIDRGQAHLAKLIDDEAERALQEALAEMQTARRQEQALAGEIEALKAQALDQSTVALKYNNLEVEIRTRRELLDELMRRQSETEVALRLQDTRESNVRVVDEALVPQAPFRPSLRNNLSMGLMAGLLLGLGGVFLLEYMDRTVKRAGEIERLLGLPVLTVVPDVSDDKGYGYGYQYGYGGATAGHVRQLSTAPKRWLAKKTAPDKAEIELLPHASPRSVVAETYRALRTGLLLSTADELKVVAVTSAGSSEGKTVTASNLAVVMAQLGRRVLLVDADLRKPRLHRIFQVSNRSGLVSHLTDRADGDPIFFKTEVPGLFVMPSGPIPPNPSELLASDRMRQLLQEARSRFDFILLDTPPVLAVTDAILVGRMADGSVLCLRAGKVLREDAVGCYDRLWRAGVKILGAVLNGQRSEQSGYKKSSTYYQAYLSATPAEPGSEATRG